MSRLQSKLLEIADSRLSRVSASLHLARRGTREAHAAWVENDPSDRIDGVAALLGELDHPALDQAARTLREIAASERAFRADASANVSSTVDEILEAADAFVVGTQKMIRDAGYGSRS